MRRLWTTWRYTFRRLRGQILGWGFGIAALGLIVVPFYGVWVDRQADFQKLLESYPPEFLAFFGGDAAAVMTPEGFLGMYAFSMLPLFAGLFAVIAGSGLLVADEEHGRLDLILAHPVGRAAFYAGRLLALGAAFVATLAVAWLGFCLPLRGSSLAMSWLQMAVAFVPLLAQMLIYATLALLLSMLLPSRSLAATVAGLLLVASYFLSSLSSLDARLSAASRWLPYDYYQGIEAIHGLNWTSLLALLGASAAMALLAWWLFQRRDIRISGEGSLRLPLPALLRRKHA